MDYVYEYIESKTTGTVHLVRIEIPMDDVRTLCGRRPDEDLVIGDETTSGIAATCKTCRRVARPWE